MLIDTHAHINFNAFAEDSDEVIKRALKQEIWLINIGSQESTSRRAVEYAQKYPEGVYAAVGLHPIHLKGRKIKDEIDPLEEIEFETRGDQFDYKKYKELASSPKVVAIGEVGLDYYHLDVTQNWKVAPDNKRSQLNQSLNKEELIEEQKKKQKENFIQHLKLAQELNKPIIIHCREAHKDIIEILKNFYGYSQKTSEAKGFQQSNKITKEDEWQNGKNKQDEKERRGVIHSFSGRWSQAQEYFKLGFYISFNGLITFVRDYDKVIKNAPLERILLETDCPYLTPVPFRGKRNEPSYVKYVAEKIAEIKGISFEEVAQVTTDNAKSLFKI